MSDYFRYRLTMYDVVREDMRHLEEKERTYQGSWKRSGGRSAWFMVKRKVDRLLEMMKPEPIPRGGLNSLPGSADSVALLRNIIIKEDIFAQIQARPLGEDSTVLAEIRDLRRYLTLVEAEMVATGVVTYEPNNAVFGFNVSDGVEDNEVNRPGTPEDGGHHSNYLDV